MARFVKQRAATPEYLVRFEPKRWIREALNEDDDRIRAIARCHNRAQVLKHWYAIVVLAPARYRKALQDAMGVEDGDAYYYQTNIQERAIQFARRAGFHGL